MYARVSRLATALLPILIVVATAGFKWSMR